MSRIFLYCSKMGFLTASRSNNRRGKCGSFVTLLVLLLSHNVWRSLQCVTSHQGQVRERQPQTIIIESVEDVDKRSGPSEQTIQACNERLLHTMIIMCGRGNFIVPGTTVAQTRSLNKRSGPSSMENSAILMRRLRRSMLTEKCCYTGCSKSFLESFCQDKSKMPSRAPQQASVPEPAALTEPQIIVTTDTSDQHSGNEPNPAIYYPLFHFIKFIHKQFGNKPDSIQRPVAMAQSQGAHHAYPSPASREIVDTDTIETYHPRDHERFEGNPFRYDNSLTKSPHLNDQVNPNRFNSFQETRESYSPGHNFVTSTFAPPGQKYFPVDASGTDDDMSHFK